MFRILKQILAKLPIPGFRADVLQVPEKASQALRQLIRSYQRQKRLWIYIILSSISLMLLYTLFSLLWAEVLHGGGVVPVAWIILAGVSIAIYQVRRCNDVIQTLRQAYTVQFQIEKAEAQREAEELEKAKRELR
ncbi:MAG: undecaprenyl pyrophosphate phosphatase UppP [Candidatus Latescibacterota bacterium]|jgi:undecaprenyl pyrophosphate phosphatase UppP